MPLRNPNVSAPSATASASASSLRAAALAHQFNPTWWCLREIDLEFHAGQLVGIVGPNGAGKSTLLRALVGQLRPTSGAVLLDGKPLLAFPRAAIARRIGYLPQDVPAVFEYTCEEVVAQGRYAHLGALGLLGPRDLEVVRRVMAWTNTDAFARRPLAHLSGGERQRVLLASVLAQESDYLLLDEPTAALDIHQQLDVASRLAQLAREGLAVVMITHDLNLAAQYCDRLVMLHEGRIAGIGAPAELLTEALLRKVYETDLVVARNPVSGAPLIALAPRAYATTIASSGATPGARARGEAPPWRT